MIDTTIGMCDESGGSCKDKAGRRLRSRRRPALYIEEFADEEELCETRKFDVDEKLRSERFTDCQQKCVREIDGSQVTLEFFQRNGFDTPMVVKKNVNNVLGMKMPDDKFTVDDVKNCVGPKRILDVMNVETQKDDTMTMKEWCSYYNNPDREELLNVISLEFSHTSLEKYVDSPKIVKQMDWVDLVWPRHLKKMQREGTNALHEMKYPKVQKYCLMSVKGCYTDFHIDFGGTSVWYHILRGGKVFWLIPPTEQNIQLYVNWTLSGKQSDIFFGDQVEHCCRIELEAGNTFFIPTGWIHAVYTLEDSLVFGGNFLHSFGIQKQIQVAKVEDLTKVPHKFRYPFFTEVLWYVLVRYVHCLMGRNYLSVDDEGRPLKGPRPPPDDKDKNNNSKNELEPVAKKVEVKKEPHEDTGDTTEEDTDTESMAEEKLPAAPIPYITFTPHAHVHLTSYEVTGLQAIIDWLKQLSPSKRSVPELLRSHELLLRDAQVLVDRHKKDNRELSISNRPVLFWTIRKANGQLSGIPDSLIAPKSEFRSFKSESSSSNYQSQAAHLRPAPNPFRSMEPIAGSNQRQVCQGKTLQDDLIASMMSGLIAQTGVKTEVPRPTPVSRTVATSSATMSQPSVIKPVPIKPEPSSTARVMQPAPSPQHLPQVSSTVGYPRAPYHQQPTHQLLPGQVPPSQQSHPISHVPRSSPGSVIRTEHNYNRSPSAYHNPYQPHNYAYHPYYRPPDSSAVNHHHQQQQAQQQQHYYHYRAPPATSQPVSTGHPTTSSAMVANHYPQQQQPSHHHLQQVQQVSVATTPRPVQQPNAVVTSQVNNNHVTYPINVKSQQTYQSNVQNQWNQPQPKPIQTQHVRTMPAQNLPNTLATNIYSQQQQTIQMVTQQPQAQMNQMNHVQGSYIAPTQPHQYVIQQSQAQQAQLQQQPQQVAMVRPPSAVPMYQTMNNYYVTQPITQHPQQHTTYTPQVATLATHPHIQVATPQPAPIHFQIATPSQPSPQPYQTVVAQPYQLQTVQPQYQMNAAPVPQVVNMSSFTYPTYPLTVPPNYSQYGNHATNANNPAMTANPTATLPPHHTSLLANPYGPPATGHPYPTHPPPHPHPHYSPYLNTPGYYPHTNYPPPPYGAPLHPAPHHPPPHPSLAPPPPQATPHYMPPPGSMATSAIPSYMSGLNHQVPPPHLAQNPMMHSGQPTVSKSSSGSSHSTPPKSSSHHKTSSSNASSTPSTSSTGPSCSGSSGSASGANFSGSNASKLANDSSRRRRTRCKKCESCLRADCGDCHFCKDMKKFGGPGRMKQSCIARQCLAPVLPHTACCVICGRDGWEKLTIDPALADETASSLMECSQCWEIVHPFCLNERHPDLFHHNKGFINKELPNSWECPKCVKSGNTSKQQGSKQSSSSTTSSKTSSKSINWSLMTSSKGRESGSSVKRLRPDESPPPSDDEAERKRHKHQEPKTSGVREVNPPTSHATASQHSSMAQMAAVAAAHYPYYPQLYPSSMLPPPTDPQMMAYTQAYAPYYMPPSTMAPHAQYDQYRSHYQMPNMSSGPTHTSSSYHPPQPQLSTSVPGVAPPHSAEAKDETKATAEHKPKPTSGEVVTTRFEHKIATNGETSDESNQLQIEEEDSRLNGAGDESSSAEPSQDSQEEGGEESQDALQDSPRKVKELKKPLYVVRPAPLSEDVSESEEEVEDDDEPENDDVDDDAEDSQNSNDRKLNGREERARKKLRERKIRVALKKFDRKKPDNLADEKDVILPVLRHLSRADLLNCMVVSKLWNDWCFDPSLWRELCVPPSTKINSFILIGIVRRQPRFLDLSWTRLSKSQMAWLLPRLPQLQSLSLVGCDALPISALQSCNCPLLSVLDLSWANSLCDDLIRSLLSRPPDSRPGLLELKTRLRFLSEIRLAGTLITDETVRYLVQHLPFVQRIDLSSCQLLTDAAIASLSISKSDKLLVLNLSGCAKITDASLKLLQECKSLQKLDVRQCESISDEACARFLNDTGLTKKECRSEQEPSAKVTGSSTDATTEQLASSSTRPAVRNQSTHAVWTLIEPRYFTKLIAD